MAGSSDALPVVIAAAGDDTAVAVAAAFETVVAVAAVVVLVGLRGVGASAVPCDPLR